MMQEVKHCRICGKQLGWHQRVYCSRKCAYIGWRDKTISFSQRIAVSKALKGKKRPRSVVEKSALSRRGQKRSKEFCAKMSAIAKRRCGEKSSRWKGGVTPEIKRLRYSQELREWRLSVFVRDNFTCVCCGKVGGNLNAHHILSFTHYPAVRFDINNGVTLCQKCHKHLHFGRLQNKKVV